MDDVIVLEPCHRLEVMTRAICTRGNAFLVVDTARHRHLVLAQKLTDVARYLGRHEADPPSVASLYEAANRKIKRVHRRWEVVRLDVTDAAEAMARERARQAYAQCVVLTHAVRVRVSC
mgnify:CR=1 FL=1